MKNRVHLDVRVGAGLTGDERVAALEAEAARLEKLGAQRLRLLLADEENESCLVMQDVEGNEFCLDSTSLPLSHVGSLRCAARSSSWVARGGYGFCHGQGVGDGDVGVGKTTILGELRRRGLLAVDTDYDGWQRPMAPGTTAHGPAVGPAPGRRRLRHGGEPGPLL